MNWYIVVIFMEWVEYPVYVFTEPTFESREACIESLLDPEQIPEYVNHLFLRFGMIMPIQGVNCINEDILDQLRIDESI